MLYNSNAFLSKERTYVRRNNSYRHRHGHRPWHRHCHRSRSRSSNRELQLWVRYCLLPRAVECPGMTMTDRLDALQKVAFLDGLGMDCNAGPSTFNGHIDRRSAIRDRLDHKLGATLLGQATSGQQNIFIRSRLKYQWGRQTRPVSAGSSRFSNPSLDFRTKAFFVTPCSIWLSKKVELTMRSAKDFGSVLRFLYWSVAEPDTQVHSELFKLMIVLNLSQHLAPVPFGLLQHFVALAA